MYPDNNTFTKHINDSIIPKISNLKRNNSLSVVETGEEALGKYLPGKLESRKTATWFA